jgi:mono/diheme cytochrome c family protein
MLAFGILLLLACGCRNEMYDQPRYEPYEPSGFFRDGTSARPLPAGTVARLDPRNEPRDRLYDRSRLGTSDLLFDTGKIGGKDADVFPFAIDRAAVERGRDRYRVYCTPCHGELGDGQGIIVQRGFPSPPPFYGKLPRTGATPVAIYDDLRHAPVGHFFGVMTHGHGAMYAYDSRIAPADRWKIAAYIRALQLSQHATQADLQAIRVATKEEQDLLREAGK